MFADRNRPASDALSLALDQASAVPVFRQLHRRIVEAVLDGRLPPGSRLPSARSLAAQLSVARGTIEAAYQMLAGEGYIVTRGAGGTLIDPALDRKVITERPSKAAIIAKASPIAERLSAEGQRLFQMGLPALDAFPYKVWARLVSRQARATGALDLAYQSGAGHWHLREQIARYLAVSRGISCDPAQVFVTTGFLGALGLITRALAKPRDAILLEHPGYPIGRDALRLAGLRLVGVAVDDEGFDAAAAARNRHRARFALVTPTHQYPLGVTMSLARRMALLRWAERADGWIIEDDYDSEFRYLGRPLPALKSLDTGGRVLFIGTFSKVLAPGLRVGYLVLPQHLIGRFTEVAMALQPPPATLVQASIADFIEQGYLARHIRRMRQLYGERRATLAAALREEVGPTLGIELQAGGMHLLARLPRNAADTRLAMALNERGIGTPPLSRCGVEKPYDPGLLIGFTNVPVGKARTAARRLAKAIREAA